MNILFIFPTNRLQKYQEWQNGNEPSTLMYGYCELKKAGLEVNFTDTEGLVKKIIKWLFLPLEILFHETVGISLHFDHVYRQIGIINGSDVIISTSDATSIPLLLLKILGIICPKKIICLSVDLVNRIHKAGYIKTILKKIYQNADKIIVFSQEEAKMFREKLNSTNGEYVQFGIDTDYFLKNFRNLKNFQDKKCILTIGRDQSRDYDFFFRIARNLPELNFVAICSPKNIEQKDIPQNVKILFNISYHEILIWLRKSNLFLLPLREPHRATGQIAFLEALVCGLPIIASPVLSLTENYHFDKYQGVFFAKNDIKIWTGKIKIINSHPKDLYQRDIPDINNLAKKFRLHFYAE